MPIFEYACSHCGHVFEKLVLTRNQDLPACSKCKWKRVEQKFSAFATGGATSKSGSGAWPLPVAVEGSDQGAGCFLWEPIRLR